MIIMGSYLLLLESLSILQVGLLVVLKLNPCISKLEVYVRYLLQSPVVKFELRKLPFTIQTNKPACSEITRVKIR